MIEKYCVVLRVKGWVTETEIYGPYESVIKARDVQRQVVRDAKWLGYTREAIHSEVKKMIP